jgi:undecaprenyl-diphosphatase
MSPDVDLTAPTPGPHPVRDGLLELDRRLFEAVAARHWPGADQLLPRLSRSANHGVLWCAAAAALAASRTPRARRAATRGLASLGLASLTINTLGKRTVRRPRPVLDPVPLVRRALGVREAASAAAAAHQSTPWLALRLRRGSS